MKRSIAQVVTATAAASVIVLSGSAAASAAPGLSLEPAGPAAVSTSPIDASSGSATGSAGALSAVTRGLACLLKTMSGGTAQPCTIQGA
ncbi:hypothetical protein [Nocardia sp. NPDC049149]|uniref:hypothetical protein n=1 Tax=Nocardia sp. NPDC049149 TaxID=3364315 RepID=UPI003710869F